MSDAIEHLMRVLQTPIRFKPDVGGVESYVYEISTRLSSRGHDVSVVCADTGAGKQRETIDGIDVMRLASPVSVANTNITPALPLRLWKMARWADIIHTHVPTPWSAEWSAVMGQVTGTPVVLTYHNDIVADGVLRWVASLYNTSALQLTLRLVNRILLTNPGYLDHSDVLAQYTHKSEVVNNGVDIERFRPSSCPESKARQLGFDPSHPNLFFLSALDGYHEYKGLDVLFAAMEQLTTRGTSPPHLVVGGDGPRREQYEAIVRDRDLTEFVTFAGYIPDDDLREAYNAADVFVLPSVSADQEGFGLVLLEALACETPVVTSDIVGISSVIRQHDLGRVVPPRNERALADGIREVLDNPPAVGVGRQLCIEEYSWSESVDDLLAVYNRVLAQ